MPKISPLVFSGLFVIALAFSCSSAHAKPVSPAAFGKVFERSRRAIVQVWTPDSQKYATGFVIGAQGEVVFSSSSKKTGTYRVRDARGRDFEARLLDFDPSLEVGLLKMRGSDGQPVLTEALTADEQKRLKKEDWVVVVRHKNDGELEPFAGVVEVAPFTKAADAKPEWLLVGTPGDPGSPVLSTEGKVLGVVVKGGKRQTKVVSLRSIAPFLRSAVEKSQGE